MTASAPYLALRAWSANSRRLAYITSQPPADTAARLDSGTVTIWSADVPACGERAIPAPHAMLVRHRWLDALGWGGDGGTFFAQEEAPDLGRQVLIEGSAVGRHDRAWLDRGLRDYRSVLISKDGRTFAAEGERPGELPQLFAGRTSDFRPRVLVGTSWLNPSLDGRALADYDTLSWTAPDGRRIWGHLVLPPGVHAGGRYPLIVCRQGGPLPSLPRWDGDCISQPVLLYANHGYLVLLPNVRSADHRVLNAERQGEVATSLPDLMAGVDEVIRRYPVDTNRMGIAGFSYGGTLTSYAITQTNRFRAASIGEGIGDAGQLGEIRWTAYPVKAFYGANYGAVGPTGDPWNPIDLAVMERNSAVAHADRVMTPNLIETGVVPRTNGPIWTVYWYDAMLFHHVPAEWWVVPRSGHGWHEPRLILDSYERNLRWFDFWLKGVPYADSAKQARYDAWIRQRIASSDPRWAPH